MKKFVFCFLAILITIFANATNWKEGDIVFQISKSKQSPLVQYATLSPWSHCGIVVEKKGQFYVLEASNVVKLTPIDTWCKKGKFEYVKKVRILDKDVKINFGLTHTKNEGTCELNMSSDKSSITKTIKERTSCY